MSIEEQASKSSKSLTIAQAAEQFRHALSEDGGDFDVYIEKTCCTSLGDKDASYVYSIDVTRKTREF